MSDDIPMMFRAQIESRCQIQRLIPKQSRQDADDWAEEWIDATSKQAPQFSSHVQTKEYKISWRFVSNSGQDEGVIRPAIGARGWPYYPGASMKGAFLRACTGEEALKYCGGEIVEEGIKKTKPGILRFHGGYPKDSQWRESNLVDVVHPQENWQVTGKNSGKHSAFIQISLYQPILVFGISSSKELPETEWEAIWKIWNRAIERGIGTRVSAGYGQTTAPKSNIILSVGLQGQGLASQLINKAGEFRPNMFKAALRGHTLRLFSGVTDEKTAQLLTKELWGGFAGKDGSVVGKLGIAFRAIDLEMDAYQYGNNSMPTYDLISGKLTVLRMQHIPDECETERKKLKILVSQLVKFAMLLGGFGKSWRRVDHRLFFSGYLRNRANPLIGCHWQFTEKSEKLYLPVNTLKDITDFLDNIYNKSIKGWVKLRKQELSPTARCGSAGQVMIFAFYLALLGGFHKIASLLIQDYLRCYRETWHPDNVQVWARIAENDHDSKAVKWFHQSYTRNGSIKNTDLTGRLGQIGRIWHRMYPHYVTGRDGTLTPTHKYVEILTIFPDFSDSTERFLEFLGSSSSQFTKVWPSEG